MDLNVPFDPSPYALKVGQVWKIVVPVKGRLNPKICSKVFDNEHEAAGWLISDEAQVVIRTLKASGAKLPKEDDGHCGDHVRLEG